MPIATVRANVDSWVQEDRPDQNYAGSARIALRPNGSTQRMGYVFFQRPFPLGCAVLEAKLYVKLKNSWASTRNIVVRRIDQKWDENRIKWSNCPNTVALNSVTKSGVGGADKTEVEIDVTTMLQDVANGVAWWGVRLETSGTGNYDLYSSDAASPDLGPRLVVRYALTPAAPTGLRPSGAAISDAKPQLEWDMPSASRDDFQQAYSQVQISTTTSFAVPEYDSGTQANLDPYWALSATAYAGVPEGATRYWRVRVQNSDGRWSPWSDAAQFSRTSKGTLTLNSPGVVAYRVNRLSNPSVETNTTSWSTGGTNTIAQSSVVAKYGDDSLKATYSNNLVLASQAAAGIAGAGPVWLSAWVFVPSDWDGGAITIGDDSTYTGRTVADSSMSSTTAKGQWTRTAIKYNVLSGDLVGNLIIRAASAPTAGKFIYIDGAMVVDESTSLPTPYFDGTGYEDEDGDFITSQNQPYVGGWTGTAHASQSLLWKSYVEETTPPITWTLTGATQKSMSIELERKRVLDGRVRWDTEWALGRRMTTDNSFNVPKDIIKSNRTYRVTVRVWDTVDRQAVGGNPTFVQVQRQFIYERAGVPAAVDTLEVTRGDGPEMIINWSRALEPDYYSLRVDGVEEKQRIEPSDVRVGSGSDFSMTWWRAEPGANHSVEIEAVVNNAGKLQHSKDNPVEMIETGVGFRYLVDDSDELDPIVIRFLGKDSTDFTFGETGETFNLVGERAPIRVVDSQRGWEGTLVGTLDGTQDLKRFKRMKKRMTEVRLIVSTLNIPVILGEASITPSPDAELFDVSVEAFQSGEFSD